MLRGQYLYYILGTFIAAHLYFLTVFLILNEVSLSSVSLSDFSSFTTWAYVGPLSMSARSFLRESSSPWASPSTYATHDRFWSERIAFVPGGVSKGRYLPAFRVANPAS